MSRRQPNSPRPKQTEELWMIQEMLNAVESGIDAERVWRRTEAIWQSDRWMTMSAWRRTAQYVAAEMESAGAAEVEVFECPADGESRFFGHQVWPTWEVREATLEIVRPTREVLGHYRREPRALMTYSAPTPKGGVETELVQVDDGRSAEDYRDVDVTGRIVFTRAHGAEVAPVAAKMGAVGVLSDFLVNRDSALLAVWLPKLTLRDLVPDPSDWNHQMHWMHISGNGNGMFGFVLSPAQGEKLRRRLRRERIVVRAVVDSAFSKGTIPAITCVIPGTGKRHEQVLCVSHLYEQGANDNASGCAASLEVASCLVGLIRKGALPQPERSIRLVQGLEVQGIMCYLHAHREQIRHTPAGICLDSLGQREHVAQIPLVITRNPADRPAFTEPLIEWITTQWLAPRDAAYNWIAADYNGGTDNIIAEGEIGIPCPFIGSANRQWHTTADTMETVDRRSLVHGSAIGAAYCCFIANADLRSAQLVLALSESYGQGRMMESASGSAERLLSAGRARGKALDMAITELRQEVGRSALRMKTALGLAGPGQRRRLVAQAAAAADRLREVGRIQERSLLGLR
jgi:hypothetical protein